MTCSTSCPKAWLSNEPSLSMIACLGMENKTCSYDRYMGHEPGHGGGQGRDWEGFRRFAGASCDLQTRQSHLCGAPAPPRLATPAPPGHLRWKMLRNTIRKHASGQRRSDRASTCMKVGRQPFASSRTTRDGAHEPPEGQPVAIPLLPGAWEALGGGTDAFARFNRRQLVPPGSTDLGPFGH